MLFSGISQGRPLPALLLACLILAAPARLHGQPLELLGGELQVNTTTTQRQLFASVGIAANGDFVVVWQSAASAGNDSSLTSIQGQRYASDGSKRGGEFQVNTFTPSYQKYPQVGVESNGDFSVVWQSDGSAGTDHSLDSVQGQRYASDGTKRGGQFQVNTYTTSWQKEPALAMEDDGDFVVVWTSDGLVGGGTQFFAILGQRFASDGTKRGGEFQVETTTAYAQQAGRVAATPQGDFVVVWTSEASADDDNSDTSIQGQRFASDGTKRGAEFQVNTATYSGQNRASVAMDAAGRFVVAWDSYANGNDISPPSIRARLYASNGSPAGDEIEVNSYTTGVQVNAAVAIDVNGNFVVTWGSMGSDGGDADGFSVQAQTFGASGVPTGSPFQVNTTATGYQLPSAIAIQRNGTGNGVLVWHSESSAGSDTDSYSVQGERFVYAALFSDGFESGDTSAWSTAVP